MLEGRLFPWRGVDGTDVGGMARAVHLLKTTGCGSPIVDAGDALGPALLSRHDRGHAMIRLMNRAGC
jgi:2',3'-cyclic-nucleotide 2'-phosphodiesterase (5'-nucleotidase family)